jgi:chromosome condensin MukBEF ATPase and DNA-binding subunit MukB
VPKIYANPAKRLSTRARYWAGVRTEEARAELSAALATNRERREAAEVETKAASAELDALLRRGLELECYVSEMAVVAGMTRQGAQKRVAAMGALSGVTNRVTKSAPETPMSLLP